MSNWQRTLNIKEEWQKLKDGTLTMQKMSSIIVDELKELKEFEEEFVNIEKENIISIFSNMSNDDTLTIEEFDDAMIQLYNWADIKLDNKFGGKAVCWIRTIF